MHELASNINITIVTKRKPYGICNYACVDRRLWPCIIVSIVCKIYKGGKSYNKHTWESSV